MIRTIITTCILFVISLRGLAQGADSLSYPALNEAYLRSYLTDTRDFVLSPVTWKTLQWLTFGAVAGAGMIAYTQDERIQSWFMTHHSTSADQFSAYLFEPIGNGKGTCILLGGLYAGGLIARDRRLAGTSLTAAKAFVVSGLFTQIIKQLAHRHRPFQDEIPDHTRWEGPIASTEFNSFSSGHSAAAFSVASVFAMEYRSTVWVPVLAYTLAGGTAVSRLYDNKHWASDVLIGSALGFVTGRFMWRQSQGWGRGMLIIPQVGEQTYSMSVLLPIPASLHRNSARNVTPSVH
jgi:membrane-associated phospholipid phosphatase